MRTFLVFVLVLAGFLLGNAFGYVSGAVDSVGVCDAVERGLYK